jgi:hypothetical protein
MPRRVNAGGGLIKPTVFVDGRVVGTWRSRHAGSSPRIDVEPFGGLAAEARRALDREMRDVERFLGFTR